MANTVNLSSHRVESCDTKPNAEMCPSKLADMSPLAHKWQTEAAIWLETSGQPATGLTPKLPFKLRWKSLMMVDWAPQTFWKIGEEKKKETHEWGHASLNGSVTGYTFCKISKHSAVLENSLRSVLHKKKSQNKKANEFG